MSDDENNKNISCDVVAPIIGFAAGAFIASPATAVSWGTAPFLAGGGGAKVFGDVCHTMLDDVKVPGPTPPVQLDSTRGLAKDTIPQK